MEDLILKANEFMAVAIVVLGAVQAVIVYVLQPEKAEKFNVVGKVLEFLVKTKGGLSARIDNKNS